MSVQKLFSIKEAEWFCCGYFAKKKTGTTRSGPWISLPSEAGLVGFVSPMGFLRHQAFIWSEGSEEAGVQSGKDDRVEEG